MQNQKITELERLLKYTTSIDDRVDIECNIERLKKGLPMYDYATKQKIKHRSDKWAFIRTKIKKVDNVEVIFSDNENNVLKKIERNAIMKALEYNDGNRTKTAKQLGVTKRTLQNKLAEYRKYNLAFDEVINE